MNRILENSLNKSQSYDAYRTHVKSLVEVGATTGLKQTENLVNYTKLNDRRMDRWDKTLKVPEDLKERIAHSDSPMTWLVITESWCGDAAHLMPVMNKVAELHGHIDFRVVLRDENKDLMDQFLTNGTQSIPKLIMMDSATNRVLGTYGPRPSVATKIVDDFKETHGKLTPEFKEDLQRWYNKDKGQTAIEDLTDMLSEFAPSLSL